MKDISQLIPDVREALQEGLEESVQEVATELRRRGPYWDGTFADNWIVQPGSRAIRPIIPTMPNVAANPRPRPATWQELDLPPSPNLGGYTLGNRTTYRIYAMDLAPFRPVGQHLPGRDQAADLTGWKVLVHPLYQ